MELAACFVGVLGLVLLYSLIDCPRCGSTWARAGLGAVLLLVSLAVVILK